MVHQASKHWLQEREKRVEDSLRATSKEAKQLRSELQRLEVVNNNLQGYGLDEMSGSQITQLISSAQQVTSGLVFSATPGRCDLCLLLTRMSCLIYPNSTSLPS